MKKYIISASFGGLSNRINSLASSIRIAEKTKRNLLLCWPKDLVCNCNFSDLFENDIKEISKEELRKIIKNNRIQVLNRFQNLKFKKKVIIISDGCFDCFSKEDLLFKFEKIDKEIQKKISEALKKLKIKKSIQKKINQFSKENFKKEVVGVHVRRGDYKLLTHNVGGISSNERFMEEIKKEISMNPKIKFFIATEDKETEDKFRKMFGKIIISYPKKTRIKEQEGAVKEALIELLLLSKCKKILGSFRSTFTELPWFLGECKPKIKIIADEKGVEVYLLKEKGKKSLFTRVKKIIYETITPLHARILKEVV